MHEPNPFQGIALVLMAALTASAPTQRAYTQSETRLAAMNTLDAWPETLNHRSAIAHNTPESVPIIPPPHLHAHRGNHDHAHHQHRINLS